MFSYTREYLQTNQFESTTIFTKSSQYSKSPHFDRSLNFLATTYFSESKQFVETMKLSKSNKFLKSIDFSETNLFTSTKRIDTSIESQKINMFGDAVFESKASEMNEITSFSMIDDQDNQIAKITDEKFANKKKDDNNNKGILTGFVIGLLAVFALLVVIMVLIMRQKRREDVSGDIFESNEEVINAELNPINTSNMNPLYDGDASIDPFEFDFIDAENSIVQE